MFEVFLAVHAFAAGIHETAHADHVADAIPVVDAPKTLRDLAWFVAVALPRPVSEVQQWSPQEIELAVRVERGHDRGVDAFKLHAPNLLPEQGAAWRRPWVVPISLAEVKAALLGNRTLSAGTSPRSRGRARPP